MDLLTKGQKITLYFQKDINIVEMNCTIEDIKDDRVELILPQYFMRYIDFLKVGKKLTAKAFSKLGTVDFNTVIISSPLEDVFTIELDYNSIKLTASNEMPSINAIELLEIYKEDILRLKTFEISADYMKFTSDKVFKIDDEIEGAIVLPKDYGIIRFKANIIERDSVYDNEYTAKFVTMTEDAKQNLLYYMYVYSKETD